MADRDPEAEGSPDFVSGDVPLYYQLATLLREQIVTRHYRPGDQLPTEAELVADYRVSRVTVRQAMSRLEDEGLIRREAGRGTFVTHDVPKEATIELDQSIGELIAMGRSTSVQVVALDSVTATREEAEELGLEEDARLVRCLRLRKYEGQPYCYIVNLMPEEIGRQIQASAWTKGSVLQYIEEVLDIPLRIAKQRVRAMLADAQLAKPLDTRIGAPVLRVDYLIRTDSNQPVEKAELYYRGDLYAFTLHLVRSQTQAGTGWALERERFEH